MRKIIKALIFILLLVAPLPLQVKANSTVSINELVSDAKVYDGLTVTINGEAVGESMKRGEYSWVNINDGTNAIGIWLSSEEADKITYYGDYKHIGDTVQITGIFSRACKEHGGEADLHAENIKVIRTGHRQEDEIPMVKIISAAVLVFAAMAALLIFVKFYRNKSV